MGTAGRGGGVVGRRCGGGRKGRWVRRLVLEGGRRCCGLCPHEKNMQSQRDDVLRCLCQKHSVLSLCSSDCIEELPQKKKHQDVEYHQLDHCDVSFDDIRIVCQSDKAQNE